MSMAIGCRMGMEAANGQTVSDGQICTLASNDRTKSVYLPCMLAAPLPSMLVVALVAATNSALQLAQTPDWQIQKALEHLTG